MKQIATFTALLFFLLIVEIFTGNPLQNFWQSLSIRLDLQNWAARSAGVEIPKGAKILRIDSSTSLTGEGRDTVYLQLTPAQTDAFLRKIKKNPEWKFIHYENEPSPCQLPGEPFSAVANKKNEFYDRYVQTSSGVVENATLCPTFDRLRLRETRD